MKKIIKSLMVAALGIFALASCEDVPAPYETPGNGENGGSQETEEVAKGDGTLANPYNAVAANAYIATLEADTESDKDIYVSGVVVEIKEAFSSYGNSSFYLADSIGAATKFYAYRALGLGNKKCTDPEAVKVGDKIVLCGKVVNYKGNTPESVQNKAYIYSLNGEGGNSNQTTDESTREKPYTVDQLLNASMDASKVWVKAYIVGAVPGKAYSETEFGTANAQATNIVIAASASETDINKCAPVQLPVGDVRTALNLQNNPGNLGKEVLLYGTKETYFGVSGVKNVSYAEIDGQKIGKDPDDSGNDEPAGEAKGDGTAANPYNVAAAIAKCKETGSTPTAEEYYVEGIVSQLHDKYANNFYLSDDGTTQNQMMFYYGTGLQGSEIKEGDLKVGDKVVVKGKLQDYNGTYELAKGCTIISLNGKTENENGGNGGNDDDPIVPTGDNLLGNGDFEAWSGGVPTNWKTQSTAGNATLSQSTDAHSGNYSVMVATTSSNKRLGYQETTLKAGTYVFSVYAKNAEAGKNATICLGYAPFKADGTLDSANYQYAEKTATTDDWALYTYEFTLSADTQICPVVRVDKNTANVLVDDASLIAK